MTASSSTPKRRASTNKRGARVTAITIAVALALLGNACSGDESRPSQVPTLENRFLAAGILVQSAGDPSGSRLSERLIEELGRAGYRVSTNKLEHHELVADIDAKLSEKSELLTVVVNGERRRSYATDVTVTIRGRETNQVLLARTLQYDQDEPPNEDDVLQVVAAFGSASVRTYLQGLLAAHRDEAAQAKRQADIEQQQAREQLERAEAAELQRERERDRIENVAWAQLTLSQCAQPAEPGACDKLHAFLEDFPTGKHAAEAKQVLEAAAPQIARLADERDWEASGRTLCAAPKLISDCDGVSKYLADHPAGVHGVEAHAVLSAAAPKLTAIQRADDRREREEEARAEREMRKQEETERRQAREECKRTCLRDVCFTLKPGPFEICMSRCVRADCD
jgi:hypothetical protein